MGGIEGRTYQSRDPMYNTNLRYFQKYIKPEINKQHDVLRDVFTVGDVAVDVALPWQVGIPKLIVNAAAPETHGTAIYDKIQPYINPTKKDIENWHMRNNKPGDLTGKPVWSKTRY